MGALIERTRSGVPRGTQRCECIAMHKVCLRSQIKTLVDTRSVSETILPYGRVLARGAGGKPGGTG